MSKKKPKIVVFDLETLPDMDVVMKHYTELSDYPGKTMNASTSSIICFGYKILGEKRAKCVNAWDKKTSWKKNVNYDYHVVKAAYDVLKDADAVVTHNGVKYDMPVLNTRLIKHGLPTLPKIPHMDTCAMARKKLKLVNNRMSTVAEHFGCDIKMSTGGWELWRKVLNRVKSAQTKMTRYCKQDVEVTAQLFDQMRPLFPNIPNHILYADQDGNYSICPSCGAEGSLKSHGWQHTKTKSYRRYRCGVCKSISRTDAKDRFPRSV